MNDSNDVGKTIHRVRQIKHPHLGSVNPSRLMLLLCVRKGLPATSSSCGSLLSMELRMSSIRSCQESRAERVSKSTVQRVWAQAQLKPHRLDRYLASDDPEFESKAADIIGLYLNPPQHAAVF
jgi:hypothetical protein